MLRTVFQKSQDTFIKRWPKSPKIVFFAAPNSFQNEIVSRFSVDTGLPIISMTQVMQNISDNAGKDDFDHPFFYKIKDMIDNGDVDQQIKDKVALKILRLTNTSREGFILTDFPRIVQEAELLEEFRGGMNSFVHLSLPDDIMVAIEENKLACQHCGREYFAQSVENHAQGIHIENFMPEDGHCFDCGSRDIQRSGNAATFEANL